MAGLLSILDSLESVIADVNSVRSSELSVQQLNALIEDEFKDEDSHMGKDVADGRQSSKKTSLSYTQRIAKWMTILMFILMIATLLNFKGLWPIESTPQVNSTSIGWFFYSLQLLRWGSTALKMERQFPVTEYDDSACVLNNPFFKADDDDKYLCGICKKISECSTNATVVQSNHQPIVVYDRTIRFNLGRFQQLLRKDERMLNEHTMSITSNKDYINKVEDLRDNAVLERLEGDKDLHVIGISLSYMSAHILRKELPRPHAYFQKISLASRSQLHIDGEASPPFELHKPDYGYECNFMYIQCLGSRLLVFTPPLHCQNNCKSFSKVMKEGEIVFYSNMWTVQSVPSALKEKSLAFVDQFELINF